MIFITLGTQDKKFTRLLDEVAHQIEIGNIKEKVIAQVGFTSYTNDKIDIYEYLEDDMFKRFMKEADIVITHGGVGSVLTALSYHKKVIAFSRLSKYKEHINDHQIQIVNEFAKEGYILTGKVSELDKLLTESKSFIPKRYVPNNIRFNNMIIKFIEE